MEAIEPAPALVTIPRVAASRTTCVVVATVDVGFEAKYNATTPATCGAAIDVPDHDAVRVGDPIIADVIDTPGANTSRQRPQLENEARASFELVAPTVIADTADAGEVLHASALLLPAAATYTMPSAVARPIALLRAEL
jgi:hypothetical protein